METMMMSCVSFSSSIPKAIKPAARVASSSSSSSYSYSYSSYLCSPKLLNSGTARRRVSVKGGRGMTCKALFGLGMPELVVIAGVAALVFGPKKLPEVGRSIGKTVKSFQQAAKEFESELKKEPDSASEEPVVPIAERQQEKQETEVSETL